MIDSRWLGGSEELEKVKSALLVHQTHFSCTPCSIYYLKMCLLSFHPNLFLIPSTWGTFWTPIQLTSQRVFRDVAPCVGHNRDTKYKVCCSGCGDFGMWHFETQIAYLYGQK